MRAKGSSAGKKEYQRLNNGNTVLGTAVNAFAVIPSVQVIVISIPENDEETARNALPEYLLITQKPKILFVTGGSTRRCSVFNAVSVLVDFNPDYVLIHDGARPWISASLIENIITAVKKYNAVIPLLQLTDTPKECESPLTNNESSAVFIKNHLKREQTGIAQTPQGFKFPEILYAHQKADKTKDEEFTDDAEIWGRFYGNVAAICGETENKKITFPEDLI
jgi:2-C-methyl-D-erythritol 4-phosphate cytidylyltransferase/2-C-methyl-D-erythritol 4-phosphate cytidylyltransferase/2-C-methyl-D-erythritol 2,4-cyclodiphosphate synthase